MLDVGCVNEEEEYDEVFEVFAIVIEGDNGNDDDVGDGAVENEDDAEDEDEEDLDVDDVGTDFTTDFFLEDINWLIDSLSVSLSEEQ